jgi:geranylgeranyl diphosphate synthase type II
LLAGAKEKDCKSLREFGINIGLGFQLKDDLLDAYADAKKFGKQVGGDILANKKTFLLIKALELASAQQREDLDYWLSAAEFDKEKKVRAVKEIYNALSVPQLAEKKINNYFKKGFATLATVNCSQKAKSALVSFTQLLITRES